MGTWVRSKHRRRDHQLGLETSQSHRMMIFIAAAVMRERGLRVTAEGSRRMVEVLASETGVQVEVKQMLRGEPARWVCSEILLYHRCSSAHSTLQMVLTTQARAQRLSKIGGCMRVRDAKIMLEVPACAGHRIMLMTAHARRHHEVRAIFTCRAEPW